MVCERCKMVVESELKKLGLTPINVQLGEVELQENNIDHLRSKVQNTLESLGFSLIDDEKAKIIEQIKKIIIEVIHEDDSKLQVNLSDLLSTALNKDYHSLSSLFSDKEGTTIEKYYIRQKVERVKELLTYGELNLNEIAYKLNYSSVAHLSNQFKKTTGLSPSAYKKSTDTARIGLDKV